MNAKIDTALQDINMIKETLEDTKVHYRGMYLMCFLMAAVNGVKYIWILLEMRYMPSVMAGSYFSSYICPLVLMLGYLYIYRSERKYSNKYYLSMIGIWGFMASVIPSITVVVDIISLMLNVDHIYDSAVQMGSSYFAAGITNIVLISVFLIICAYILNKRIFMVLAILNLFFYMILDQCFHSEGIPFSIGNQTQTRLLYSSVYTIAVTSLGYLALGFYLLSDMRKARLVQ